MKLKNCIISFISYYKLLLVIKYYICNYSCASKREFTFFINLSKCSIHIILDSGTIPNVIAGTKKLH